MKIPIFIFGVLVTSVNVECISIRDAVNLCYDRSKVADGSDVCLTEKKKCTMDDLNNWVFLYNGTKKLQDFTWGNRRFACFHACMMIERGEMTRGKIDLEKYIENLAEEYEMLIDEVARWHINECLLQANDIDDECSVAAIMGECVTDKWNFIDKNLRKK